MTIHAAKGLEFPFVYVTGLEENLFPNTQMLASQADLEEERRLFYVAVTRAERNLTLSHAQLRFRWGELVSCEPSRFLDEIDESLLLQIPKKMSIPVTEEHGFREEKNDFSFFKKIEKKPPEPKPVPRFDKLKRVSDVSSSHPPKKSSSFSFPLSGKMPEAKGAGGLGGLKPGMRVEHQKFGAGTVISVEGVGDNAKANVNFDDAGQKMLMLRFAILREVKNF